MGSKEDATAPRGVDNAASSDAASPNRVQFPPQPSTRTKAMNDKHRPPITEEIAVAGSQLVDKVKELMREM